MEIINRRQRMSSVARKIRREDRTIGLVPTMGALHEVTEFAPGSADECATLL